MAAAAAALAKAFRGGRRSVASSRSLLLLPRIGRRAPLEGGVGPLLPRLGASAPTSWTAPATPFSPAHRLPYKVRFMCSDRGTDQPSLADLKKYYVAINGSFLRFDSKYIPLFLWKMTDDLDFQFKSLRRYLIIPTLAFTMVLWILSSYFVEYVRLKKIRTGLADLNHKITKAEEERAELMAKVLQMKEELVKMSV